MFLTMPNNQDAGGVQPLTPGTQVKASDGFTYTQKGEPLQPHPGSQTGTGANPTEPKSDGRKFADKFNSPDELEKAYKSLESKLGELGAKAKEADKFKPYAERFDKLVSAIAQEQGLPIAEVMKAFEEKGVMETQKVDETAVLKQEISELKFFDAHPELRGSKSAELLRSIAKSQFDGNLEEALASDTFRHYSAMEQELKSLKEGTSVVETNPKISQDSGDYSEQFRKAQSSGDWREVLRQKGILPKK